MNIIQWDGKKISKPGFYSGVPLKDYHSGNLCVGPSVSSSGLRTILAKSEAHFWDQWPLNPKHDPDAQKETESLILGRATHHILLREPLFSSEYVVRHDGDVWPDAKGTMGPWNGNKHSCQKWIEDQHYRGLTILTSDGMARVRGMAMSLAKQPLVQAGALNGVIELTLAWQDKATGVWCLARPDVIPTDSADVVDLKTTTSVAALDVQRTVSEYRYHQQGAMVGEGFRAITGQRMASFSLYFIESDRPFCPFLYRLHDDDLERGRRLNEVAMHRFVKAFNTGVWPGPGGVQSAERTLRISDRVREIEERLLT